MTICHLEQCNDNHLLSHNLLSRLEGEQFYHLTSLQILDLSFNQLTHLAAGLLQNSTFLSNLYLQGNKLATLLTDFLPSTGKLKLLQLEGNPWQCDCRLLHLPPLTSAPPCDKLQDCPATVIALTKLPGAPLLQCHASGWPRPQFTWLKDGNPLVPEASKETEDEMVKKPVHIFSTLRDDPQPGNYTCIAGESSTSIMVVSKLDTGHLITLIVVVAMSTSILLILLILLLFYLWRRSQAKRKEEDRGLTTSLAGLEYRSTKLSTTNTVSKPPRTFTFQASTLDLVEPPENPWSDPPAMVKGVTLPSPGYETIPKMFVAPSLGPRCSGDGSSFGSLNLACGTVAPIAPLPISTPVNVVNNQINTSGLPPSYSPMLVVQRKVDFHFTLI